MQGQLNSSFSGEENFMKRITINAAAAIALLAPAAAFAQTTNFQTIDTIPWPDSGRFPAYTGEALRPTEVWVQGGLLSAGQVFCPGIA